MSKTFTLTEAQVLLPAVKALLERARDAALRGDALENAMQELTQRIFLSGGMHVDVPAAAKRRADKDKALADARESLQEIESIGVTIGDSEDGLLEFPSHWQGREILLCWSAGDAEIEHWREVAEGSELQPIAGLKAEIKRNRPN